MNLKNLKNKKIAILGLGIENYALINFLLSKKLKCEITICDSRNKKDLGKRYKKIVGTRHGAFVKWRLGKNYDKNLKQYDIIFRSPGYPLTPLSKGGVIVSSPMKLFFELCSTKNIIGVTGTKGKGTTASLIYEILKSAKKKVWLGGNIGVAPFEFINKIKKNDWVVLELSSFQLEDMEASPHIAVITNFTKEHLAPADPNNPNYHKTLRDYRKAKINVFRYQKKGDYAILNSKSKITNSKQIQNSKSQIPNPKSKVIYFTKSNLPSKLVGEHNKENIAAAIEAAKIAGVKKNIIEKVVKNFKGLEHRLELVKKVPFGKGGKEGFIKYYNDTFATTPEATITALNSFSAPIILIAGGAEKKSDFKNLAKVIKKKTKFVVLLNGEATPRLRKEILKSGFLAGNIKLVYNMKEAVRLAKRQAAVGDVVLLSPACASFGMFKNYKERGELFKEEVKKHG